MQNDTLFSLLLKMLSKYSIEAFGSIIDDENSSNRSSGSGSLTSSKTLFGLGKIFLIIAAILIFVGEEAVKIVFRKNFGRNAINIFKLILAVLSFIGIGILALSLGINNNHIVFFLYVPSFVMIGTGIFYIVLAIFILIKGIKEKNSASKSSLYPSYEGDSNVLGFLVNDGWSENKIQILAEPLLCLALGFFLTPINPILGIPIIFCSFSVWIYKLTETAWGLNPVKEKLEHKGYNKSTNGGFSEVKF